MYLYNFYITYFNISIYFSNNRSNISTKNYDFIIIKKYSILTFIGTILITINSYYILSIIKALFNFF